MEAFIVTPAPPQAAPSSNSPPAEHSVNEASFAPALSQAMQNRNSSSAGKQDSSTGKPSATESKETTKKTDSSLPEDLSGDGEEQVVVSSGQPTQETAQLLIASYNSPPEIFSGDGKKQAVFSPGQPTHETARQFIDSSYSQTGKMSLLQTGEMNNPTNNSNNQQGLAIPTLQALKNLTTPSANLPVEAIRAMGTAGNGTLPLSGFARAALKGDGAVQVAVEPQGSLSAQSSDKILELLSK